MKCPICEREGLKSYLYTGAVTRTLMGYESYYDEEGSHHNHDSNITTFEYSCSNNHKLLKKVVRGSTCCDAVKGSREVIER